MMKRPTSLSSQRIIVTGAAGLIGSFAFRYLTANCNFVFGTNFRHPSEGSENNNQLLQLDLTCPDSYERLEKLDPTVIVHCAAALPVSFNDHSAQVAAKANRSMDNQIITLCQSTGCRLIYLSSTSVYGLQLHGLTDESAPVNPIGPYAKAKYEMEQRIAGALSNYAILRVSAAYGVGQRSKTVLQLFVQKGMQGAPISYYGTGQRQQDFIAAQDIARAISMSVASPTFGILNIGSGQAISMRALAELIAEETGNKSSITAANQTDPQELFTATFDIRKAASELTWRPEVSLKEGIKEVIEHYIVPV